MNKVEAMEWAADYAERNKLFLPPMKGNGYPVDGWKAPSAAERADIITKLAWQVMDEDPKEKET